jgi:hypothetical protein
MFPFTPLPMGLLKGKFANGAIQLPAILAAGIAQLGLNIYGSAELEAILVNGNAAALAQPTITITTPTSADTYTFEGTNTDTESMTVAGTATAGSTGSLNNVTYSVTGATTQSGTATGTTSWTFNITALNFGNSVATATANHINGQSKNDVLTLKRTPRINQTSNYSKPTVTYEIGGGGYIRGENTGIVSYRVVRVSTGAIVASGYCTTGTGSITFPWGAGVSVPSGCLGYYTPKIQIFNTGQHRLYIVATNAAGNTDKNTYTVTY